MKTTFRTILCAVSVMLAAASCQKSAEPVLPVEEGKGTIDIRVNGLMGEYNQVDATKAELVNTVRVSWTGGETVYVYDGTQYLGSLAASLEGTEDRYAILSTDGSTHTVSAPASGTKKLTLVYSPLLTEAPDVNSGEISISLAAQSGAKPPFVAYATLDYSDATTITGAIVPFKFATSVIKVNCTGLTANTAIDKATLSNVNTACKLTLSGAAAPTVAGDAIGSVIRTGDAGFDASEVNNEGEAVFQIAVPALVEAAKARVLTVAQGSNYSKDKKFSIKAMNPATSVNTICQLVGLPAGALPGEFSVSGTKQVYFSKGNLWADGSNQLHFEDAQWKSTPAFVGSWDASHVSHFTWSDNVESAVGDDNSGDNLFCDESHKQSVDGSEAIYYALSKDEWVYLFNKRTALTVSGTADAHYAKATVNNKAGIILLPDTYSHPLGVTALKKINVKNAVFTTNSYQTEDWEKMESAGAVFLPAAGNRNSSSVTNVESGGYYLSSTADGDKAYIVRFYDSGFDPDNSGSRSSGFSVRLITECQ